MSGPRSGRLRVSGNDTHRVPEDKHTGAASGYLSQAGLLTARRDRPLETGLTADSIDGNHPAQPAYGGPGRGAARQNRS
jgi:hypothetical protein